MAETAAISAASCSWQILTILGIHKGGRDQSLFDLAQRDHSRLVIFFIDQGITALNGNLTRTASGDQYQIKAVANLFYCIFNGNACHGNSRYKK